MLVAQTQASIEDELAKRAAWAFESELRKHNSIGLIHSLLLNVATNSPGTIPAAIELAKKQAVEKRKGDAK